MQRTWVLALIVGSGLLAQTPPPAPPPAPEPQAAEAKPQATEAKPQATATPATAPAPAPEAQPFDQWRPTRRKYAYALDRAVLAGHELAYYHSHPRTLEVRDTLETLVRMKADLPEKAQAGLAPVEAYLGKLYAGHGLYDADGKKLVMEGTWKGLQSVARAAAKASARAGNAAATRGLEARLARLRRLLFDPKVDAVQPTWAEPEAPAKGKRARRVRGPKAPEGFHEQKAVVAYWVKQAMHYVEDTPQTVEIKGEKRQRLLPDPVQTKALGDLVTWLDRDDLEVLRDPGLAWLDLRRLGALPGADQGRLGLGLLAKAGDIEASKGPEGAPGPLPLLPVLEPVMGVSPFSKGDEKRPILADVKLLPPPASLPDQMAALEKLGRSRSFDVK